MSKHTPGPWQVLPEECDKPYIRVRGTALGCLYKIANVVTPTYEGVRPEEAQETRANARLIAAAPDLLKSLKAMATIIDKMGDMPDVLIHPGPWQELKCEEALQQALVIIAVAEGKGT